jgi:light-regulated signal transduction histidine kinase (bacteriophytochrome)
MSSGDHNSSPPASPAAPQTPPKPLPGDRRRSVSGVPPPLDTTPPASTGVGKMPVTSSVSIFSGVKDPLPSPTSSAKNSALSPEATDRVFPVRSVVSVDPAATPMPRGESGDDFPGMSLSSIGGSQMESARQDSTARSTPPDSQSVQSAKAQSPPRRHSPVAQLQSDTSEDLRRRHSLDATVRSHGRATHCEVNNLMRDDASLLSEKTSGTDGAVSISSRPESVVSSANDAHLTARFKHVVTDGGHAVITGGDGDTLQRCEDEPIHIPGAIQSFGLLIALRDEAGKLVVRVVSENSAKIIGYTPQQLFRLSSFVDILTVEQADNLLDHLDFIRDESAADPAVNGPEVFMLSLRTPNRRTQKFWCAIHVHESNKDLIICEFELEDDAHNPLVPAEEATPAPPEDTLGSNPTPEELAESTVNVSKPLRVLRSARRKKGEAAAMEVFNIMAQVQEQLASAVTLEIFLKTLIGVVKELTGFHRVMIYQFDHSFNGRVVSELVDPRATKDLYMGLNFPASDIPKQARDLYRINKVRLLYDREQETSRLVCRTVEDLEHPVDMTFTYLRALSPIHIKYLHNMAVRSSMSISINAFNELWGLIACHSYGQRGMRVSFPIRKMCRLVGDIASRNIERLSYASRLQARKLINTAHTAANPSGYIVASSEDLLDLFAAHSGALSIRDETKVLGRPEGHLQEILAMLEFLRLRKITSVFTSNDITTDFPDLRYPPGFQFIAGLLFVPLSSGGSDFIVFFRKGSTREVKWAGNPYEKFVKEGTEGYLEPRKSFKTWSEVIVGKCRDWTEQEIETAAVLCLVYGKFIEVWRQKEAALQNSQLQKLLLANSAHEVRTPLNAIINYLEIALEGSIDRETRENLTKSHSASKSLVYVINDLLDLTKTEEGLILVKEEIFDFHMMMQEATEPFQGDAKRKGIDYQVSKMDGIPRFLVGDPRRVRQVVSNIIANAIQHTSTGFVKVETCKSLEQPEPQKVDIEIAIEDTGAGMPQQKVDALFRELEQVSYENEDLGSTILERNAISKSPTTDAGTATLGLGLAVVARAIRNMNGQLRLKTEEGRGSRFVIQLVMNVPVKTDLSGQLESGHATSIAPPLDHPTSPLTSSEDRVWPANRSLQQRVQTLPMSRRGSQDSVNSVNSKASVQSMKSATSAWSAKSDVDRLIDDIQKPHLLPDPETPDLKRRSGSKSRKLNRSNSAGDEPSTSSKPVHTLPGKPLFPKIPGEERITDSLTPLKAVRLRDSGGDWAHEAAVKSPSRVAFELPERRNKSCAPLSMENLSVLVAEDDPVNSKIMKKRLEKLGHSVHLTVNGEECSSALGDQPASYDVILMDLQVSQTNGHGHSHRQPW